MLSKRNLPIINIITMNPEYPTNNTHLDEATIHEFKTRLERERARLQKELETIAEPNPVVKGDWRATVPHFEGDADAEEDPEEAADKFEEYEVRRAQEQSLEGQLAKIDHALQRIEAGTFGLSIKTGKPLPLEQLHANPAAEYEVQINNTA